MPSGQRKRHSDPARDSAHRRHLFGDTPERRADRAKQQVRKMQGEWSYIKPMVIPGVSPTVFLRPLHRVPKRRRGKAPEANRRAEQLKQRQSLTDAFSAASPPWMKSDIPKRLSFSRRRLTPTRSSPWFGPTSVRRMSSSRGLRPGPNPRRRYSRGRCLREIDRTEAR